MSYNKTEDTDLIDQINESWNSCEGFFSDLYEYGQEDQEFLYGQGQWDSESLEQRRRQKRPALVLNQLLPFAHQVINDIKKARPAIRVSPVDEKADAETAEIFQGIIRNIERQSSANIAYDTAAMNSVGAGLGWIRITTEYANEMSFDQEIFIERNINFQSIYIDPNSTELDGSDMDYAFVFEDIPKKIYEERYPDAATDGFYVNDNDWYNQTDDTVRIAEHFYKEMETITIYMVEVDTPYGVKKNTVTKAEYNALIEEGIDVRIVEDKDGNELKRDTEITKIKHCIFNGTEVLESTDWLGKYIPIVPVIGEEVWLNGRREFHSLIRQAKDAQRMSNFWKTSEVEVVDIQHKAPVIGATGSFASFPDEWAKANSENLPFLEYDVVYDENGQRVEPPQRQMPPQGSPALTQGAAMAVQDIKNALGMHEASMGQRGNEISGIAVRNRQIYGDNANFHFMDNLSSSIAQVGRILVDLIPKLYNERMVTRILGEDGSEKNVPINQPFIKDEETGNERPVKQGEKYDGIYKLGAGKYDVVCDVGASYSSKRQELADKLTEIYAANPNIMALTGDIFFDVLDMPRSDEIAKRLQAQMPPEIMGDDPQAAKLKAAAQTMQQMEEQLNTALAALEEKKNNEQFDMRLDAEKAQLERDKFMVEAEKTKADIQKIYADIGKENAETAGIRQDNFAVMEARIQEMGATLEMLLDDIEQDLVEVEPPVEEPTVMLDEGEINE